MDPKKQVAEQRRGGGAEVGVVMEGGRHRPGKAEPGTGGGGGWGGS